MSTLKVVLSTIPCPIEGYETLQVTFNVGGSAADVAQAKQAGEGAKYVADFPNWEQAAPGLGLVDDQGQPLPKPLPVNEHADALPFVVLCWLMAVGIDQATGAYIKGMLDPNLKRT
jgi:hypothetical protein